MKRLTITDIRNRIRSRLEGAEDFTYRDRYERLAETAIDSAQPSQICTVIEYGCINNDRLSLDTMCRLFDALYEYGDVSQIKKYGNSILKEYVSKVRDAKETQTYLKKKLGLAKSKVTTKIQNNFDDIKDAFNRLYSGGKSNLNRNVKQISSVAKKAFPNNPMVKNAATKESAYIGIYESMVDKTTEMVSIDRILENYNRISKRFNIDRIIQENTMVNGIEDTIVELCELIDTYDMSVKARYNTCLETCWYGLHKNSFSFSESELVTTVTNYYMTHGKNGKACASILEVSTVFDKKDYMGDIDILMEEDPEETVSEGKMDRLYRVTYNGVGIYEAFKNACTYDEWKSFKNSDAVKWLPVPKAYGKDTNNTSYFTELGYSKFKKNVYPIIAQKLDKGSIKVDEVTLSTDPVYSDLYQVVVPATTTRESSHQYTDKSIISERFFKEDEPISEWHHYDESIVDRPNNYRSYTEYSPVIPIYEVKMNTKDKVLNVLTMGNHWKKLRDEELHKHINDKFSISPTNFKKAYENWYITVAYDSNMTKDSDDIKVYRAYMIAMYDFEPDIMICSIKDFIREYNVPRGECTYGDDPNITFVMYSFPEEHGPVLKETYGGRYFTDIVDNQVRMILYKHSKTYKIKPYVNMDNIIATQRYLDSINAESYIGEVKYINDEGEDVPKVCPECGADVKVYLKGEPVFVCSNKNCSKYFGTVPFKEDGFDPFGFKKRREERERLAKIAEEKMKKYDSAYKSHLSNITKICANKVEYMTITDSISFESMYGAYVANIATFVLTNDMDNEFAEKYGYGSDKHIKATNGLLMNAEKKMKTLATKVDDYISKHDLPGRAISRAHDDYVVIEIEIPYENTSVTEAKLTSEQRAKLKDSDYGIPSKKKYPMPDESHVRSAIQMFNHVSSEDEAELAKNIKKKIKQYGMSVDVGKENRFSKYYTSSNETATIQNAIREYATGNKGYPDITLKEATDFNKILDDFKASNDEHKESKLKMLVNKLYSKNVDNIVDGTPSLLSYIRTFFIIGTFAVPVVGPVIGIIAFIADRIVALHMDRENTLKMRAAFQKEIRATDKKIDSTKDSEKRSRLEEYRKSLMNAYDKIDEYYSDLLSEKEMDEKFENPDDDDIRMRSSGSMGGDDFSDFDFGDDLNDFDDDDDFENMDEASRYIVYTSKLANIFEFQCIHKTFNQEACRVMISKYPSFIKELADVAIKFPTIIDPRDLRRSIDDIRSDAKINNMHISVIEKYDLDNAYNDLDRAIDNQKTTRPRDITFESYKLGVAIEITRTLNEVYSSCMYYSPIVEASFMNTIKLASEKLKQSFQKLSDKEKTISRNLDVSVNNFAKAAEKSMTDDNREAILKGSVLPKASKIVKLAIANIGIGVLIDPVVAVIGTLGYLGVSAHMKNKQKRAILDEIEVELKMCQKYIDLAESKNDLKSLKKLYTIQRSLERQKAKIMYNLKTKGESYHTTEELGNKY